MLDEKGANMRHLGTEKSPKGHTWAEQVAKMIHLGRNSFDTAWRSRKWVFGGKMHRIDLQKCDPHRGRKHFFKKRVKMIASAGKRATKVGVGECYAYVGGSGGVIKSPK